ncbi:MAG: hypothetical protein R2733_02655 [Acidimicrobiales bacterium]
MSDLSGGVLVGIGCLLCFGSALGGALVALAIDEPDVVVAERVVEVAPPTPSQKPLPGDLERLASMLIDAAGTSAEVAPALVDEIGIMVCDFGYTPEQVGDTFVRDITMSREDIEVFVAEVLSSCAAN